MVLLTYVIPISKFESLNSIKWLRKGICEDLDGNMPIREEEGGWTLEDMRNALGKLFQF